MTIAALLMMAVPSVLSRSLDPHSPINQTPPRATKRITEQLSNRPIARSLATLPTDYQINSSAAMAVPSGDRNLPAGQIKTEMRDGTLVISIPSLNGPSFGCVVSVLGFGLSAAALIADAPNPPSWLVLGGLLASSISALDSCFPVQAVAAEKYDGWGNADFVSYDDWDCSGATPDGVNFCAPISMTLNAYDVANWSDLV